MTHSSSRTVAAAAAAPDWRDFTSADATPGTRCRLNVAFRSARDRAAYPVQLVALARPGPLDRAGQGSPLSAVGLAGITAAGARAVTAAAVPGAVLVATSTSPTSAEFAIYAQDQAVAMAAGQVLRAALAGHRVTVHTTDDSRWRGYHRLARERRRGQLGQLLLALFPLLAGAMVLAHYGRWWALAELSACAAWAWSLLILALVAHITGRRDRAPRVPASSHLSRMFVVFAWVFASVFFSIIALVAGPFLPAVAAAGLAVTAGLLVTALVWPAQRRYTAMVRSRLLAGSGGPPAVG
jgi:hypothetical protein